VLHPVAVGKIQSVYIELGRKSLLKDARQNKKEKKNTTPLVHSKES